MLKTDKPIVIELQIVKSSNIVWEAITDPNHMRLWFFEQIKNFEPKVEFETLFIVQVEDRVYPHRWKIIDVIPEQKIVYDWSYDGYEGKAIVTFELKSNETTTNLTLTNVVKESFPQNVPEFSREMCIQGWEYFTNRLKKYVETAI